MLKKHLIQHKTKGLSELEWQAMRKSFAQRGMTGGSDAGILLGWSRWSSPISMYYKALGLSNIPSKMNIEMAHGKQQESSIADAWTYYDPSDEVFIDNIIHNRRVRKFKLIKAIIENPIFPTLFANIDGLITKIPERKGKGILEIKKINGITIDSYQDGLPPQYLAQVQHYMLVTELPYAQLCMRVDGRQLVVKTIDQDITIQQAIITESMVFQDRVKSAMDDILSTGTDDYDTMLMIASKYEPPADASEDFNSFLSEKHKLRQEEITIQGDSYCQTTAEEFKSLSEQIKTLETDKQLRMNILKQIMEKEGASVMQLPAGKITWRKNFSIKLD